MRIEAERLSVRLGQARILAEVSLDLHGGEIVALIGPNGAGKTTLLRALAGLVPVSHGIVRYDGRRRAEIGRADLARRLAFLAQGGEVNWALRVDHVVELGRLPHRRPFAGPVARDHEAVERALAAAEVNHLRLRACSTLSGGERMRVLLARALAVEAEMLLADEPIAALDPLHQLRIMQMMRDVARGGAGVVVVLHDLTLASRFCDRIVLIAKGRILLDGPVSELSDDLISQAYGVSTFRGAHEGEAFVLPWVPTGDATHPAKLGDMT
jgi:iron complex transport system ATP-binding protein